MGHVRAAEALLASLKITHPNIEARHIDLMDYLSPIAKYFYFKSYGFMAKKAPWLWGAIYRATQTPKGAGRFNQLTKLNKIIGSKKFLKFVANYRPDYILCTHFTPADLLANFSGKYNITNKIGQVITDYATHPLHFSSAQEDYFVATETMKKQMIDLGADTELVTVSGIPIDPIFYENKSVTNLKNAYRLDNNKKTLLFLAGGCGFAKIDQLIQYLFQQKSPFNIIAIAGKNQQLYQALQKLTPPPETNFQTIAWTDTIDEYIRMADIVITKSGGITISECLYLQKPMIIIDPVPGVEEYNLKFLEDNGYGVGRKTVDDWPKIVDRLIAQPPPPNHTSSNANNVIISAILKNLF